MLRYSSFLLSRSQAIGADQELDENDRTWQGWLKRKAQRAANQKQPPQHNMEAFTGRFGETAYTLEREDSQQMEKSSDGDEDKGTKKLRKKKKRKSRNGDDDGNSIEMKDV